MELEILIKNIQLQNEVISNAIEKENHNDDEIEQEQEYDKIIDEQYRWGEKDEEDYIDMSGATPGDR